MVQRNTSAAMVAEMTLRALRAAADTARGQ